jgi:hypothetical protein
MESTVPDLQELFSESTQKARPVHGALLRQHARQRRRRVAAKVGTFAVAAAIGVGALALAVVVRNGDSTTTPADDSSVIEPGGPAEVVARRFLDAFGSFDPDRAMTYVADDAGFTGLGGFPETDSEDLSMLSKFLVAFGWDQTITSCEALEGAVATDTNVVCEFDWHGLRSDEVDRGPYRDSEFVITVRDAEIVEAAWYWNIQRFSDQMWDPFAAWISESYPEDVEVMYQDGQTNFRLSAESIRLWDRRSREYVRELGGLPDGPGSG